ncbi:hypothetical protein HW115_02480 [Verrucomicrobiaceae bacterium N1E253]|uniref:Uncharacterized protein n=1 Tax=Oceaniferula marina TaxID=2748318 RepID=A0A851GIK5_9BACT|nr:hypothetical protein [Oceaniferula marina]
MNGSATGRGGNTSNMATSDDPYALGRSYDAGPDQNQRFAGNLDEVCTR